MDKKINFFISTVLLLGIISGAIFLMMSNETDKTSVMNQIKTFFQNKTCSRNRTQFQKLVLNLHLYIILQFTTLIISPYKVYISL